MERWDCFGRENAALAMTWYKKDMMPKKTTSPQHNTKASLSSLIKSARDIMRKDAGLNGDLDRLPQLSWILFLKVTMIWRCGARRMRS